MSDVLRLACIDTDARPVFWRMEPGSTTRKGYEPTVGALVAEALGRRLEWVVMPWADLLPSVNSGCADAVLCGQGIVPARRRVAIFSEPYGVFHEAVIVRADANISSPSDLSGKRVAALANSANSALVETFDGTELMPFEGTTDDVLAEMLQALEEGTVDAVVDDEVALVPLSESDPRFDYGFTVRTSIAWGFAVGQGNDNLRQQIDGALRHLKGSGALREAWEYWIPYLEYPFDAQGAEAIANEQEGAC